MSRRSESVTPECPFCGEDMRRRSFPHHLQDCDRAALELGPDDPETPARAN